MNDDGNRISSNPTSRQEEEMRKMKKDETETPSPITLKILRLWSQREERDRGEKS